MTRCIIRPILADIMRIGFVSDVHGNLEALQTCLQELDRSGLDRLVFLGDAVGYGANPNEVCDLLRARTDVAILGNHDAAVVDRMDLGTYYPQARQALRWCQARLSAANGRWLRALPYTHKEGEAPSLGFCHGSPRQPEAFEYLVAPAQVEALLPQADALADITFIGHSHLQLAFGLARQQGAAAVDSFVAPELHCEASHRYIVTVGSVGQPRDRDPRACCGTFDSATRRFVYHRLDYDIEAARVKILAAGLPAMFGDRLRQGV